MKKFYCVKYEIDEIDKFALEASGNNFEIEKSR